MQPEINSQFMWRRMYLRIQDFIQQRIDQLFGDVIQGGKVQAGFISGSDPTNGINMLSATGDVLSYNSGLYFRLPIGAEGQVLTVVSGLPAWVNPAIPTVGVLLIDDGSVQLVDDSSVSIISD